MSTNTSRRNFIKELSLSSLAITIVPRHVLGHGYTPPSDKINLGFIGLGKQSRGLSKRFLEMTGAQIVAGCDVWTTKMNWFQSHVEQAYAEFRNRNGYKGVAVYEDYHQLIARDDIDAVIVATPDHWHAIPSIAAMKAGKDVFCEKPLTHTIEEGRKMVKTAKETGRIVQTGSMQRSTEDFRKACELVRNGYIGKIEKVLVTVGDPAMSYNLSAEPLPKEVNWERWCGPAPILAYNHRLSPSHNHVKFWPDWRLLKETGGGILCDWGAHMFDIAQWGLDMDRSGPVLFEPPKKPNAVRGLKMTYANGIEMLHWNFGRGYAVRFIGRDGTIDVSRGFLESNPANIVTADIKESETHLYDTKGNHYQDWIDAIKNRTQPICDVETGHRSATVCNLANIAYRLNRPLRWDPVKEQFIKDREANKLRKKKNRRGYKT